MGTEQAGRLRAVGSGNLRDRVSAVVPLPPED